MHTKPWRSGCSVVVAGAIALAGCADDPAPPVEGDRYQYAVGALYIPENNTQARTYSLDLNGDTTHDNQLGMIFGTLSSMGLGVTGTAEEALLRGQAIMLAELQTTSFADAEHSGVVTYLGANPDPVACADPSQIATCGRHLATRASYEVVPDSASGLGRGAFEGGRFRARTTMMPIEIVFDPDAPLRVDLHAARVQFANMSASGGTAILAGGLTTWDMQRVVIPEAARQMSRIVASECGKPSGVAPCGCPSGSGGRTLEHAFDDDDSCVIETDELLTSSLIESLTAPDMRIDGENLLSFGIGVDLVPASFAPPSEQ